jgi:sortase A
MTDRLKVSRRRVLRNTLTAPKRAPDSPRIGRISIPRLNVTAIVEEGTDDETLTRAVGHIPGTALPGANGNVAIAGHRDSFFRSLKDLRETDTIDFETLGGTFHYRVDQITIVDPKNVSVIAPTPEKTLTIVTCFPFRFIGPAPRRFIVRARQVSEVSKSSPDARKSAAWHAENSRPR